MFPPDNRCDGFYYMAPDSAKPLPDCLWEELDPGLVEKEVRQLNQCNSGRGLFIGAPVESETRNILEQDGLLGQQVILLLESGAAESADALAEIVLKNQES
jgi:hypothetical protein